MKNKKKSSQNSEIKKNQWKWKIIGALVLVMAASLGFVFYNINYKVEEAAISNLAGTLSMVSITADRLMQEDAKALSLIAEKAVAKENMEVWFNDFCATNGQTGIVMTKPGEKVKLAGSGTDIPLENLNFPEGIDVIDGISISESYKNSDGQWVYALSCPVLKDGEHIADLISEYAWNHIYQSMPGVLYQEDYPIVVLDQLSGKMVVQTEESIKKSGILQDMNDFMSMAQIEKGTLRTSFQDAVEQGYVQISDHRVDGEKELIYVWPVNSGSAYLLGMVPVRSIISEIPIVKYSILFAVAIVLLCSCFIGITFGFFNYQEKKELKRIDAEREKYNRELQEALDKARRADAAKTVFLSNMSHDMRTPLNGITGLLKIEESHPEDLKLIQSNRKKMKISAEYLLSLVSDLLQMSKLENDNIVLGHEIVDLRSLAVDIVTLIGERAVEKSIAITYEQNEEELLSPYIYTSPLHIRQLFLNIYGNAVKYNRIGGTIHTSVSCVERKEGTEVYQWIISDTGIGMSEEFQKHIFEPFAQERSDARSVYSGAGLGMSIVKKIVDAMHGSIDVKSTQGEGSSFRIILPFEIADEEDVLKMQQQKEQENSGEYSIEGYQLLLAEDNVLNAEIAETLLRERGASVTTAENGKKALEILETNPPGSFDAVLMDMMMPVMDGLSATRAIRKSDRKDIREIPVIAMTANVFEEDEKQCLAAGMNAYLPKPLQIEKTVKVIAKCCSKRASSLENGNRDCQ